MEWNCTICGTELEEDFKSHYAPPSKVGSQYGGHSSKSPNGSHCPKCGLKYIYDRSYEKTSNEKLIQRSGQMTIINELTEEIERLRKENLAYKKAHEELVKELKSAYEKIFPDKKFDNDSWASYRQ